MGWRKKMEKARRLHRPSLKDWEQDGMYEMFPDFVNELSKKDTYQCFSTQGGGTVSEGGIYYSNGKTTSWNYSPQNSHGNPQSACGDAQQVEPMRIPAVLDAATTSLDDFFVYEREQIPCVIRNIPKGFDGGKPAEPWTAQEAWQPEALAKNEKLLYRGFKCGEDDDGKTIRVKLRDFLEYTKHNRDDSPLYVFDSTFDEDSSANRLLRDYRVPSYFSDDLFGLVSESRRPPYRWFLVGPERSGTCVHIDPLATSAWNTLISGQKRWVLFPPHIPKDLVKGRGLVRDDEDDEAIHYFMFILPRIKRQAASMYGYNTTVGNMQNYHQTSRYNFGQGGSAADDKTNHFFCYEFTQNAGETVYIPHGWWHAVLNLTDTVGVTQNFCSPRNFDHVWLKTRSGRKRMAYKWLVQLRERGYAHLADRALELNRRDRFVMKYDPVEIAKREAEEKRRREQKRMDRERKHRKLEQRERDREQRRREEEEDRKPSTVYATAGSAPYEYADMYFERSQNSRSFPNESSTKRSRIEASH